MPDLLIHTIACMLSQYQRPFNMNDERERLCGNLQLTDTKGRKPSKYSEEIAEEESQEKTAKGNEYCTPKWMTNLGYLLGLLAAVFWGFSICSAQALGGFVPTFQLNLLRFGCLFICVIPIVIYRRRPFAPRRVLLIYLGVYCASVIADSITYYEASIYVPVGTLGRIEASCLIVLTALTSLVNERKFRVVVLIAVLLCISGIVLLVQPSFIFGHTDSVSTTQVCVHARDMVITEDITTIDSPWTLGSNASNVSALLDAGHDSFSINDHIKG